MERISTIILMIAAMLAPAVNVQAGVADNAQPLRRRFYFGNSTAAILEMLGTDLARRETNVTDSQKKKVALLKSELVAAMEKAAHDNPENVSAERDEKRGEAFTAAAKATQKKLDEILSPSQLDRLWEIMIQDGAFQPLGCPELYVMLVKVLKLTDEETKRLDAISSDAETAMAKVIEAESRNANKPTQPQTQKKMLALIRRVHPIYKLAREKSLKVLTPNQREMFAKMTGKAVDHLTMLEEMVDTETTF